MKHNLPYIIIPVIIVTFGVTMLILTGQTKYYNPVASEKPSPPIYKEQLFLPDYIHHETEDSKIIPGVKVWVSSYFCCPRCGNAFYGLVPDGEFQCDECKLNMEIMGNTLYIWEETPCPSP